MMTIISLIVDDGYEFDEGRRQFHTCITNFPKYSGPIDDPGLVIDLKSPWTGRSIRFTPMVHFDDGDGVWHFLGYLDEDADPWFLTIHKEDSNHV